MTDSPTDPRPIEALHTRRDFIKDVLKKSAYAAPIISTFIVAEAGDSEAKKKKPRSGKNKSKRKISKVSRPSRPSSGSGIKYSRKESDPSSKGIA